MNLIQTSQNPVQDLEQVAYEGQPAANRQYREGYEHYLESMPVIQHDDPMRDTHVHVSSTVMTDLADKLLKADWIQQNGLGENEFERTIIAMENPHTEDGGMREGVELLVAKWGKGFASPIHGHANGLLHEDLLYGTILVNTYSVVNDTTVRPYLTRQFTGRENIVSEYNFEEGVNHPRPNLVHNFVTVDNAATLHYVAEHTRDGRDNGFEVEYFDQTFDLTDKVRRISSREAYHSKVGDVILVRSASVPHYGNHFIVVTGSPVAKAHGIRPKDHAVPASPTNSILDNYEPETGLVLLKLDDEATQAFFDFHKIQL